MARGINKVILIGNLGADPEVRYTPNGSAIANISLATSDVWRDKQNGELQERTEWHRVVFFNRLAEIVGEFLRKGSKCYVEGALRTRKWQDKNGQERYTTEIVAAEMQILDGRSSGNSNGVHHTATSEKPRSSNASENIDLPEPQASPAIADPFNAVTSSATGNSDDVPF